MAFPTVNGRPVCDCAWLPTTTVQVSSPKGGTVKCLLIRRSWGRRCGGADAVLMRCELQPAGNEGSVGLGRSRGWASASCSMQVSSPNGGTIECWEVGLSSGLRRGGTFAVLIRCVFPPAAWGCTLMRRATKRGAAELGHSSQHPLAAPGRQWHVPRTQAASACQRAGCLELCGKIRACRTVRRRPESGPGSPPF